LLQGTKPADSRGVKIALHLGVAPHLH